MATFFPRLRGYGSDLLKDSSVRVETFETRMFDAAERLLVSRTESDLTKRNVLYITRSIVECRDLIEFLRGMRRCVSTVPSSILLPVLFEGIDYYLLRIGGNDEISLRGLLDRMKNGDFPNFVNVINGLDISVHMVIKININVLKFPCKNYVIDAL